MSRALEILIAAAVGGLLATIRANAYYNAEIWKEQKDLAIAKLRKQRAKVEAEIDEIYTKRTQ